MEFDHGLMASRTLEAYERLRRQHPEPPPKIQVELSDWVRNFEAASTSRMDADFQSSGTAINRPSLGAND
jgi:hypothetical protein